MCINRDKVKSLRINKGFKRAELAVKMGVSEATIWHIETDQKYDPRIYTMNKLAEVLEVEIKELLL